MPNLIRPSELPCGGEAVQRILEALRGRQPPLVGQLRLVLLCQGRKTENPRLAAG